MKNLSMSKKYVVASVALLVAFFISACGSSSDSGTSDGVDETVKQEDECSEELHSARVFLKSQESYYVCDNGKLVPVDQLSSSSGKKVRSSSSTKGDSSTKTSSSSSKKNPTSSNSNSLPDNTVRLTLSECDETLEGSIIYLEDLDQSYICKKSKWIELEQPDSSLEKIHCTEDGESIICSFDEVSSSSQEPEDVPYDRNVGATFVDKRDNQVYRQVVIGDQLWMAQNLNYASEESVCPQDDDGIYCDKYGRFYPSVKGEKRDILNDELCPSGWVIPSSKQWEHLFAYVDANNGKEGIAKSLKAKEGWFPKGTVVGKRTAVASGKDKFGFSALPAGSVFDEIYVHDDARFWTSDCEGNDCLVYKFSFDSDTVVQEVYNNAFSVRCINLEYSAGMYCNNAHQKDVAVADEDTLVCDNGAWRRRSEFEKRMGVCNRDANGVINVDVNVKTKNGQWMNVYYTCDELEWRESTRDELLQYLLGKCSKANHKETVEKSNNDWFSLYHTDITAICFDERWYYIGINEPCTKKMEGIVFNDAGGDNYTSSYTCKNEKWVKSTETDAITTYITSEKGACTRERQGEKQQYFWTPYEQNLNILCYDELWYYVDELTYNLEKVCDSKIRNLVVGFYTCDSSGWRESTLDEKLDYFYGKCVSKTQGLVGEYNSVYYICDGGDWRAASLWEEIAYHYGMCTSIIQDSVASYKDKYYTCDAGKWRDFVKADNLKGVSCSKDGKLVEGKYFDVYVCDADTFRVASSKEIKVNLGCTSYTESDTVLQSESIYYDLYAKCVKGVWKDTSFYKDDAYGKYVDERDGQEYRTVEIEGLTWFAQNLNVNTKNSFCYNDSAIYCEKYGRLYTWDAAMTACPSGWHLPETTEWDAFEKKAGGAIAAWAKDVWAETEWLKVPDTLGFSALPAGYYLANTKMFYGVGGNAYFWSASDKDDLAYYWNVSGLYNAGLSVTGTSKSNGYSVRCVQNAAE